MTRKIIAAAAAAVLLVFATSSDAKPLKVASGCVISESIPMPGSPIYADYFQTFKPTFSLLKTVSLALWGDSETTPLASDVTFTLSLWTGSIEGGSLSAVIATSTVVLPAGSTMSDALSGYTAVFTFLDGATVTPGVTHTFQLEQIDNASTVTHACVASDAYADGAFFWGMSQQGTKDWVLKATGTGRAR